MSVMSTTRNAIWSAIAVSATFGAVQLAFGHDLTSGLRRFSGTSESGTSEQGVNRAAKADRAARLADQVPTQTISLRLDVLSDTSVLIRIPVAQARKSPSAPAVTKSGERKMAVACEPVVSILTEVAKQLQPGRCVT